MSQLAQRLFMASGGKKDSTYVDDVFSTYLYKGNGTLQTVINGIKLTNNNAGSSVHFDGNDYLSIAASSDFHIGSGDYTVEAWIYKQGNGEIISAFGNFGNYPGWLMGTNFGGNNGKLAFYIADGSTYVTMHSASDVASNSWQHVAVTKSGTTFRFFLGGNLDATHTSSIVPGDSTENIMIGADKNAPSLNRPFTGYISNVRITKGQALYTSSFTPSTEALTVTSQGATASNVKLLCCQSSNSIFTATKSPTAISSFGDPQLGFGPFTANDGEGGMTWIKGRTGGGYGHRLVDTVRGATKAIESYDTTVEATESNGLAAFNNNGFTLGSQGHYNGSGMEMSSWTWRKQKGFFDVVTWTGNNTAGRQIPHNLGSRPGMVAIKCTSDAHNWTVWHRNLSSNSKGLILNDDASEYTTDDFNGAAPTSEVIYLSATNNSNGAGKTYVAYLWAGGASTAATARSVDFDGSGDSLTIPDSADFDYGSGDFTLECWVNPQAAGQNGKIIHSHTSGSNYGPCNLFMNNGVLELYSSSNNSSFDVVSAGTNGIFGRLTVGSWSHIAVSRNSNNIRIFLNGELKGTTSYSGSLMNATGTFNIAQRNGGDFFNGWISNFRVVKGTGVYTSSFKPPTEPLTNITNTKLLCCNDSSTTGSTVTPGTITASGDPTASTDSPFDDPEGYKFGKVGDQNLIKVGSYKGNSSNDFAVFCGWEPQYIMFKSRSSAHNWSMFDSMRGIVTGGNEHYLYPNLLNTEYTAERISVTPTGFTVDAGAGILINENDGDMIYMAIRRPDGYVGKPPEAGTDVFAMDTAASAVPRYNSGFPVDFAFKRRPATTENWSIGSRLLGKYRGYTNTNVAFGSNNNFVWDSNTHWPGGGGDDPNVYQAWMWKRGPGMDVVMWDGNGSGGRQIAHNLGRVPEMMWVKSRTGSNDWRVYHSGVVGGYDGSGNWNTNSNAAKYQLYLNNSYWAVNNTSSFNETEPTSTHFTVGTSSGVNTSGNWYVNLLFSSVAGISKVGSYTGTANSAQSISLGFQPRFLIIKNIRSQANNWTTGWFTYDTTRGWISPNTTHMFLNDDMTNQTSNGNCAPTSTGFDISAGSNNYINNNGEEYIYYAHA